MAMHQGDPRGNSGHRSTGRALLRRPLILALALGVSMSAALLSAPASDAAPGALRILIVSNQVSSIGELAPALEAEPGVAVVETFDSSVGTPSPASLATYDIVVGSGDSEYEDPELWGNRLAEYLENGGAEVQFAYDNWESSGAHPTGRFESEDFPPFIPGPNENFTSSLGEILVPSSPLLAGVPSFTTHDNTTPTLAAGATLLANWENGKPAIATKGRVMSVSASLDEGQLEPISAAAQLVVNAAHVFLPQPLTVSKAGTGTGTVTSTPAGISCGANCAASYPYSTVVTLHASPSAGSSFAGWSGAGCSGTSTCTVTMSSPQAVTASFTAVPAPAPAPVHPSTPPLRPSVSITNVAKRIAGRKAKVTLACANASCAGKISLAWVRKTGKHGRTVTSLFSRASYTLAAGKSQTFTLTLTKEALKLLERAPGRQLKLRVRATDERGAVVHQFVLIRR
jgi:Divergent InlB B-repeat domain